MNPKAKDRHHCQKVIKSDLNKPELRNEFQVSGNLYFRLNQPIPPHILDNFCVSRDFTRLPKLISIFQDKNGNELKDNLKESLAKTQHSTHANHIKTCVARVNVLCVCLVSSTYQDPHHTVLICDTGTSFGLKPFKSYFIDYVNFNIPVKDITKVNTVIGIRTTIHKFVDANAKDVFLPCVY